MCGLSIRVRVLVPSVWSWTVSILNVDRCGGHALFVEFRRLSSSGDLLRPRLASTSRLRVDIFSMMERRRWRMMLRLASVGRGQSLCILFSTVRHTTSRCEMTDQRQYWLLEERAM
jgi:hypothetical protein